MKLIALTKGQTAMVDDEDYEILDRMNWCVTLGKQSNTKYYAFTEAYGLMHRLILGAKDGQLVDHIDGNGLNNQKSNLRICTPSQNQHNRAKDKRNKSGVKGVSWDKVRGQWTAHICVNKKQKNLGRFATLEEAAEVVRKAREAAHGDFTHHG